MQTCAIYNIFGGWNYMIIRKKLLILDFNQQFRKEKDNSKVNNF